MKNRQMISQIKKYPKKSLWSKQTSESAREFHIKYIEKSKPELRPLAMYMVQTWQVHAQSQQQKRKVSKLKCFIIDLIPS